MNNSNENDFNFEKVRFIRGQGVSISVGLVITASFLYWVLIDSITDDFLLNWYICILAIIGIRAFFLDRFIYQPVLARNFLRWKIIYFSVLSVTGIAWGYIAWNAFPIAPLHHQALIGLVFIGLLGGMVGRYSIMPEMVVVYCLPFILPFTIQALSAEHHFSNMLGWVMIAYAIIMTPFCLQVKKITTNSIQANIDLKDEIKQREAAESELLRMATTDSLTQINNRRNFYILANKEIDRAVRYEKGCCLMMLDLDNFKQLNDNFGHSGGDLALEKFVQTCQNELRASDIIGRIGGDEFAILLPETDESFAKEITERLRDKISKSVFQHENQKIFFTVSIGVVSTSNLINVTLDSLLNKADKALYHAKASGRNCTKFVSI